MTDPLNATVVCVMAISASVSGVNGEVAGRARRSSSSASILSSQRATSEAATMDAERREMYDDRLRRAAMSAHVGSTEEG